MPTFEQQQARLRSFVPQGSAGALELQNQGFTDIGTSLPDVVKQALDKIYSQGFKINEKVQINEKSLDEFLTIAGAEISPFYVSKLKLASDDLKKSLGYSQENLLQGEQDLERKYGRSLKNIGESSADVGFAQSGQRVEQERELAGETQRAIETGRRQLQFGTGQAVGQFSRQFGGMQGFQLPGGTLPGAPRVLQGQAGFEKGADSAFYELSDDVYSGLVGSEEFARRGAIRSRGSEMEQAQNLGRALPRTLNL